MSAYTDEMFLADMEQRLIEARENYKTAKSYLESAERNFHLAERAVWSYERVVNAERKRGLGGGYGERDTH